MGLSSATLADLKRFNQSFPLFYQQFVSSEVHLQNYQLAYRIYRTNKAAIAIKKLSHSHSLVFFGYRNQSLLLAEMFKILSTAGLLIERVNLYGQVSQPMLVFLKLVVSHQSNAIAANLATQLESKILAISAKTFGNENQNFELASPQNKLENVQTDFFIDRLSHLPALAIATDAQLGLTYRVFEALGQEDLRVINASLSISKGRAKFRLYLLGPDGLNIPEHLGMRIANGLRERLMS
jgi:hypothetical protein